MSTHKTLSNTAFLAMLISTGDAGAWTRFDDMYRPVITDFARRLGLREADAADAAQQTIVDACFAIRSGKYDRSRGRLRSYLLSMARFRAADLRRKQRHHDQAGSHIADENSEAQVQKAWQDAFERTILASAIEQLRERSRTAPKTLRVFELMVLHNVPAPAAARQCGISTDDAYVAKHRVAAKLREIMQDLSKSYEVC